MWGKDRTKEMCVNHCFEKTLYYTSPGHGGWGIIRVAALIPESHLLFICPSACFRHGALGAVQHGYKNRTSYLYITPADIVVGYDNIIMEGAEELLEKDDKIKVLFLFVPCLDDFIGTDMEAIAKAVQERHPNVIVRACHMNPIAVETKKPPLVTTIHAMFSTIQTQNPASENAVNLMGTFALVERECELFDFFADYGIEVRQLGDYQEHESFCEMGRSKYNLIVRPAGKFAAQYMDEHFDTTSLRSMITYDMDEIRKNYEEWEALLDGKHDKKAHTRFCIEEQEKETRKVIAQTVERLKGIPISVSDSAVLRPFTLAKALIQYGFNVTEVIEQEVLEVDRPAYEYICENHPEIKVIQPRHYRSAVRNNENTYMVAIGFEGAYLRQSDYVVDLSGDEGMYGYYGVRRLMHMLQKAVEEKADLRKMIEEYGAVV